MGGVENQGIFVSNFTSPLKQSIIQRTHTNPPKTYFIIIKHFACRKIRVECYLKPIWAYTLRSIDIPWNSYKVVEIKGLV